MMKDEIKEILDRLKDSVNNPIDTEVDQFTEEAYDVPNYFCLDPTTNDCKILLDCITNLQEERERLIRAWETAVGDFEKEYAKKERAKEVYIKELIEAHNRGEDMPLVAVEMYNILEGNK